MIERTLAVIKPGAVHRCSVGDIISAICYEAALTPLMIQRQEWTRPQAEHFYLEHAGKPFFEGLVAHAVEGACYAMALEGEDAVQRWRVAMGPTDPKTLDGNITVRSRFGVGLPDNAVHGSASLEEAVREINLMRWWFGWVLPPYSPL